MLTDALRRVQFDCIDSLADGGVVFAVGDRSLRVCERSGDTIALVFQVVLISRSF